MKTHGIVIPAHNEGAHLEASLSQFLRELDAWKSEARFEILIVENGSSDDTPEVCRRLEARFPDRIKAIGIDEPSYGSAIRRGIMDCSCSHLSILECDCLDVDFVRASLKIFDSGEARFILASKRHPDSVDRRPWSRRVLTLGLHCALKTILRYPGTDTRGLKSIETKLARELCALAETSGEVFQTELVLLAWRLGHEIKELPIQIGELRPTPVAIARRMPGAIRMIRELRRSLRRFPPRPPRP